MEKLEMWPCSICKDLFVWKELWRFDGELTCDPCISKRWRVRQWPKVRERVLKRDNNTCQFCLGKERYELDNSPYPLEIDHIIPKSQGGTDDMKNLRTLCFFCHRKLRHGKGIGTKNKNSFDDFDIYE